MQKLVKGAVVTVLVVFAATALLTLSGIGFLWFGEKQVADLPYLGMLVGVLIAEAVGLALAFARRGIRYLPLVVANKTARDTELFMKGFIAHGSSVTIVSNRLAWLQAAPEVQDEIVRRAADGVQFQIITSTPVESHLMQKLQSSGAKFYVVGQEHVPEARFTLINANRSGAERLAIAKGTHPDHEITIFDSASGPQIIGLAKDIIARSRALIDAKSMG